MSLLSRLFGSKKGAKTGSTGLDERLKIFEVEAESARPGYQGTPYNKAGDLALREGDKGRAIKYYGRAIDAFLEDAQREAARGVANKIIRVHPKAVRTLCTLTWLDLASQHRATALLHLRDYVEAAKDVNENARAAEQVYEMARLSSQSEFLAAAADALDSLGFEDRASEVRGWVGSGGSADALADPEEVAAACVTHAVSSNSGAVAKDSERDGPSEGENEDSDSMGESEQAEGAEDIRGGDVEPADPVSEEVAAPVGAGEPADDAESTDESVSMGDADATAGEGEALPEAELDDEDQPAARKFSGPAPPAEEAKGTEPTADDDATVARRRKKKKRR